MLASSETGPSIANSCLMLSVRILELKSGTGRFHDQHIPPQFDVRCCRSRVRVDFVISAASADPAKAQKTTPSWLLDKPTLGEKLMMMRGQHSEDEFVTYSRGSPRRKGLPRNRVRRLRKSGPQMPAAR